MDDVTLEPGSSHPLLAHLRVSYCPARRCLCRGGRHCYLAPREAEVFGVLIGAPAGAVVSRDELLDRVWGNGDVCEDALTVVVSRLRRHFADLGVEDAVIETVPRRGYRLCEREGIAGGWADHRRASKRDRILLPGAFTLALLAFGMSVLALLRGPV